MSLTMKVTSAGRAALVNASNTGTAPVTIVEIGLSETAVVPSATATSLPGEFKRIEGVAGDVVAADTIHVNVTDGGADTYALRSFALYLGDGTLFAIYGQAEPFLEKTAQSIAAISIDAIFADIDAALITFGDTNFLNPPATTERAGVVKLLTSVDAIAGADTDRAATAKAVRDAVTAWLDARFGANNSGIWHPGNDGAGSGLDADLFEGKHGSHYLSAENLTGTVSVPVNAPLSHSRGGGYFQLGSFNSTYGDGDCHIWWDDNRKRVTMLDALSLRLASYTVWHTGNDGAGSGLDADLLDGQHGSYYRDAANLTGTVTVPVYASLEHRVNGGYFRIGSYSVSDYGNGSCRIWWDENGKRLTLRDAQSVALGSGTVWHTGNDGAGSGLDADTLDGKHASAFLLASAAGIVRAAAYAMPNTGQIPSRFNVSSITYSSSGGSGNGARAIVTYSSPISNSVPVAMGGDTYNSSSSQAAFWGAGSSRNSTGFTACFGVSGGGGIPRLFSFVTVGA